MHQTQVCKKQLNHNCIKPSSCAVSYAVRGYGGSGSELIHLDDVSCNGTENMLTECGHSEIGIHNCITCEEAAVICSGEDQ